MTAPSWTPPSGPRTRLVLVRHGATAHSAARRFSGRNDLPLDDVGRAQATALARREFGTVEAIVSSPLRRARETAAAMAERLALPVETDERLAELDFGAFEGLRFDEARTRYPRELSAWSSSSEVAPPDGESFAELDTRVAAARAAIVEAHPGATVLVVTHVSPIKSLVRAALDAPPPSVYRMYLDTASVSVVDYTVDGVPSLRLFNDTAHLTSI